MLTTMFAAGVLALVVGLAHSVLGEVLIFRRLRDQGLVPTSAPPPLKERNIRIIWATWHAVTLFGWSFAIILLQIASANGGLDLQSLFKNTAVFAFLGSSLLVLFATKGRHPGWIGLLAVAVLVWFN